MGQYQQKGTHTDLNPYLGQRDQNPCNRNTLSFDQEIDLMDDIRNVTENVIGYQFTECSIWSKTSKYPSGICSKNVNQNQQAIFCSKCSQWYHRKCSGTSDSEYERLISEDNNIHWYCIICIIESNADIFPFGYLSRMELLDLNRIDLPSQLNLLPSYDIRPELQNIPTLNDFDVDENYIQTIDSKYYDITDFMSLNRSLSKYFALLQTNVRNLAKHFDELQSLLSTLQTKFDVIGISETKENIDTGFITNVDLSRYHMYTQPSKSAAGGVAIYVNDKLDHISKDYLNIVNDDFEAIWIEIKNKKSKNYVCGCVYRHPNRDPTKFFQYLETNFAQLNKEKQNILIMGDFNFEPLLPLILFFLMSYSQLE